MVSSTWDPRYSLQRAMRCSTTIPRDGSCAIMPRCVYMVHNHTNRVHHQRPEGHGMPTVAAVYATTETLTARRHMEYDCVRIHGLCCCQCLVTSSSITITTSSTTTTRDAYALGLMLSPAACTLCVLLLSPCYAHSNSTYTSTGVLCRV